MELSALAFILSMKKETLLSLARKNNIQVTPVGDTFDVDEIAATKTLSRLPQTPGEFINELLCDQNLTWDCISNVIKAPSQIEKLIMGKLPVNTLLVEHLSRILNVPESDFWQVQRDWDHATKPFGGQFRE